LATLAEHVYSVDIQPELTEIAKKRLESQNINNVSFYVGDAVNGFATSAPYDVIVFTGSMPMYPTTAEKMLSTRNDFRTANFITTNLNCVANNF
jgi:protein-L-isoaspartate(D-aspartate) O-methyltransferase